MRRGQMIEGGKGTSERKKMGGTLRKNSGCANLTMSSPLAEKVHRVAAVLAGSNE
jgi:hypothetical protein